MTEGSESVCRQTNVFQEEKKLIAAQSRSTCQQFQETRNLDKVCPRALMLLVLSIFCHHFSDLSVREITQVIILDSFLVCALLGI